MCFHRPRKKPRAPEALPVGLPTRWPCLWSLKAVLRFWPPSHLTASILPIPCSCMCAHVLVSAGIKTVTKLSSFIVSYKISNHTRQVGNLTDSEGHGERSLMYLETFCHLVASTLFHPVPPVPPHSTSSKLPMPALQGANAPCPLPFSGSFSPTLPEPLEFSAPTYTSII